MKTIVSVLCLLLYSTALSAQPFTLDKKFKATQLKLNKFDPPNEPKANGRISISKVTQREDTLFYFVKGVSVYSPVYVALQSDDSANSAIEVSLHKLSWKRAERSGTTDASGHWEDQFKTENDFGIRVVVKDKPATYTLMVWAGDESKIELPSVFKKVDISKGDNVFRDNLLYFVIAGLVMLALVLLVKLRKKNK